MFDELNKYKKQGHFFFQKGDSLAKQSKGVPNLPGVYYIIRLAIGRVDLVYISKSGTLLENGEFDNQLLKNSINTNQEGISQQEFFEQKIAQEEIDGIDIYWHLNDLVKADKAIKEVDGPSTECKIKNE